MLPLTFVQTSVFLHLICSFITAEVLSFTILRSVAGSWDLRHLRVTTNELCNHIKSDRICEDILLD